MEGRGGIFRICWTFHGFFVDFGKIGDDEWVGGPGSGVPGSGVCCPYEEYELFSELNLFDVLDWNDLYYDHVTP